MFYQGSSYWFAVQVKTHQETPVARALQAKGYEAFVPTYQVKRRWSDRAKMFNLPLFPTYTFCRFDPEIRHKIVSTPGVRGIVGFGKGPVPISDTEIQSLKIVQASALACEPGLFPNIGQKVEIVAGSLAGVKGSIVSCDNRKRMVVSIELINACAIVDVDDLAVLAHTDSLAAA
jgi:transcription antitermination factor NusG